MFYTTFLKVVSFTPITFVNVLLFNLEKQTWFYKNHIFSFTVRQFLGTWLVLSKVMNFDNNSGQQRIQV